MSFLGAVITGPMAPAPAPLARTKQTAVTNSFLGATENGASVPAPAPLAKHAVSEGTKAVPNFIL